MQWFCIIYVVSFRKPHGQFCKQKHWAHLLMVPNVIDAVCIVFVTLTAAAAASKRRSAGSGTPKRVAVGCLAMAWGTLKCQHY